MSSPLSLAAVASVASQEEDEENGGHDFGISLCKSNYEDNGKTSGVCSVWLSV
jgi:hypothetical protein